MTMPLAINLFLSNNIDAMVVYASIPMLIASLIIQRHRPRQLLIPFSVFNASDFIISASAASVAYYLVGGHIIGHPDKAMPIGSMILALTAWTAVYNIVNALLGALGSSMYNPQAWKVLLVKGMQYNIPNFLFSIPVSILFVKLYMEYGWKGILLLIIPLFAGRHAANMYAQSIETYRDTITSLGSFMQHYHPYTRGHQERVAKLADMLGRELRLPVQSLMYIKDAGLLHDIGKVGVDYALLDKNEKLSPEDWAIIKEHPVRGAEIITQMHYLDRIVPWIRCHHERPDGKGYPNGISATEIPIEASVLAVADAFDAMTGGLTEGDIRVYRAPLSVDAALEQVSICSGTQFHPQVAEAFIKIMSEQEDEDE
ncbi:MAG: HD-GYP domain-containing protein [Armatimonadota bacterium]